MKKARPGRPRGDGPLHETVRTLHALFQHVDVYSRRMLREFGVSGPQIWALRTIAARKGITIGELTEAMFLHISTVSGILDRLEERALVSRERMDPDRRVVRLTVTRHGHEVLRRAPEPPRSRLARGLRTLKRRDVARLRDAVRRLARLMGMENSAKAPED
jgi:DNA-binding MarR family transcriptional regulator